MLIPILFLSQTLYIKMPSGMEYRAVSEIPDDTCITSDHEELVVDIDNFNTCNRITLPIGCYRVEMRGGVSTNNPKCADNAVSQVSEITSGIFTLTSPTTIYALRGGDGNAGTVNGINNLGTFGGSASGVDSILTINEQIFRASGTAGYTCTMGNSKEYYSTNAMHSMTTQESGNGLGGKSGLNEPIAQYRSIAIHQTNKMFNVIGGGGGGAPNDTGSTTYRLNINSLNEQLTANSGENGTQTGGGNGGDTITCTLYGHGTECSDFITVYGGTGGKNVTYECGGTTTTSYGGGGGGGSITAYSTYKLYNNGGDGGSGSTGHSDVSYLRIYKL